MRKHPQFDIIAGISSGGAKTHKDIYSGGEINPVEPPFPENDITTLKKQNKWLNEANKELLSVNRRLVDTQLHTDTTYVGVGIAGLLIGILLGVIISEVIKIMVLT